MLIRIGVEVSKEGHFKAFIPGVEWGWALAASEADAVRRLKLMFLNMLVEELTNNTAAAPASIVFTVDSLAPPTFDKVNIEQLRIVPPAVDPIPQPEAAVAPPAAPVPSSA